MKNPLTPAGIEPATFQFVAQHLNHCATAVPQHSYLSGSNITTKGYLLPSKNTTYIILYRVIRNDCRGDQIQLAWPPLSPDATTCDIFL